MQLRFPATALALAMIAIAGPAASQVASDAGPATVKPDIAPNWLKRPTSSDLLLVWPKEAMRRGVSGQAVISCKVSVEGALFGCRTVSESPPGAGFGAAAIALTPQFLMKPAMKDGHPVVAEINIPVAFKNGNGAATASQIASSRTVVQNLTWVEAPSYFDAKSAYPTKAREAGLIGHVALQCMIRADGRLEHCNTVTEQPKGAGFGKAAHDLTSHFRAPTTLVDGQPTRGMDVSLPFTFTGEMMNEAPRIGVPLWTRLPQAADIDGAFPKPAGVNAAQVFLDCRVAAGGQLEDCSIDGENPPGLGFGSAALSLASHFAVSIWTAEGLPTVGGRIRVPIRYEIK